MENKFFTSKKIYDNVTCIAGMGGELCYLVEGKERALLIDGLSGVGSLKAFVRELTELPVTLVITHGHVDHAPAIYEFGEGYIHPDDIALMYSPLHSSMERRLNFALGGKRMGTLRTEPTMADVIPSVPVKTYPVYDGDIFDLGGTQIEVVHVPGHTYGSIALIDKDNRACYTGDCCNANTLLFLPGSTTIEEYKESLLHFKTKQGDFDVCWGGHGAGSVPNTVIDEGIALCDEILAGTDDAVETDYTGRPCIYAKKKGERFNRLDGGVMNIAYSREMLHKRPHPVIKGEPNLYK